MSAAENLVSALAGQVTRLETDLRARVESQPEVKETWQREHTAAVRAERTAAGWTTWRDEQVTLVAVSWVLTTVFIRFCEDNDLLEPVWIAPRHRRDEANEAYAAFFRDPAHTLDTDREWLLEAVGYLRGVRATAGLVDDHAPLWKVSPSGDAASALLEFWRQRNDAGRPRHGTNEGEEGGFYDEEWSTRFLGDLYQDLSADARERYALLQTPRFVEKFILDHTLTPALKDRPLEGFRLLDPTCGSGHFLLGAFPRLLEAWNERDERLEPRARVQKVLDSLFGVDLNPDAVAIARFRLTVLALRHSGGGRLEKAPAFRFHLACGDSLRHGEDQRQFQYGGSMDEAEVEAGFAYSTEDLGVLREMLEPGSYDVVVGNPPYITVKDQAMKKVYRDRFISLCKGKFPLSVPFMAQFFWLARHGERPGWVGQITSNSFMKREFGVPIVEKFLANKDLRLVVDSEGAWIQGHNADGTPTVIIIGTNQPPTRTAVRSVLSNGKRETRLDGNEGKGPYWSAIIRHLDEPGYEDEWITITDLDRTFLARHPWSLTGGGSAQLIKSIEAGSNRRLRNLLPGKIGFASFPGADDCFFAPRIALSRDGVPDGMCKPVVAGDTIRDWEVRPGTYAFVPYDKDSRLIQLDPASFWARRQWRYRTVLGAVIGFDGQSQSSAGAPWWGWYRWVAKRYQTPLSIAFAEVASHNHFVLDRGGRVFKQTAPVIKLPAGATEREYQALLGVLNSSTACFWLRDRSKSKGGAAGQFWSRTYQYNGTRVADLPLPPQFPADLGRLLDVLADYVKNFSPSAAICDRSPTRELLDAFRKRENQVRRIMIAIQEELDWQTYHLYELTRENLSYRRLDIDVDKLNSLTPPADNPDKDELFKKIATATTWLPEVALGERAFEIGLARAKAETGWFTKHGSSPITEIPKRWPADYRELVKRRLVLIASDTNIRLLEKPEHKRRWLVDPWEMRETAALRDWLLDRLEDRRFWFDAQGRPAPKSIAQLADEVARDPELVSVLELWAGRRDVSLVQALTTLLAEEAVPFHAGYRYKPSGLRKRRAWEETWAKQREEDAAVAAGMSPDAAHEKVGRVPVPQKYAAIDFVKPSYAHHRGELDVPKERFVAYPHASRENDPTPLLGWAGWDHAQQSLALSVIIAAREAEGWDDERLLPLVAGLAELQPWVDQWHTDVDPRYGVSLAEFCREQLTIRAGQVRKTRAELVAWVPKPAPRPTRKKSPRKAGITAPTLVEP